VTDEKKNLKSLTSYKSGVRVTDEKKNKKRKEKRKRSKTNTFKFHVFLDFHHTDVRCKRP
jgi:hypothetical protein